MHQPPAVSHNVQRSRWHLIGILVIWFVALAASAALWQSSADTPLKSSVLASAVSLGVWAVKDWFQSERGSLRWDGQQWLWSGFGDFPVQHLFVVLDFQRLILVKLRTSSLGVRWIWLEASVSNRQWLAMRRALFATVTRL